MSLQQGRHPPYPGQETSGMEQQDNDTLTLAHRDNAVHPNEDTADASDSPMASAPSPERLTAAAISPPPAKSGVAVLIVMAPLCLSVILSALDLTIVTPAVPAIVASFSSVAGYIWVGSSYILAYTAITPVWGSVADIWGRKPIILIALSLFMVGSLLCALAPHMDALIAGRVVQGLGASGMGVMVNVIISDSFSLRDRSLYLAITSLFWAVGSAVGPVVGGLFTTRLTWRWCFWINLPIGVVVFLVLFFFLSVPNPHTPVWAGLKAVDWPGSLLVVGGALMVLLGLDFGNVAYPWSSATVICLLVFGGAVIGLFVVNEWKFAAKPIIPLRLFSTPAKLAPYGVFASANYVYIGLAYYLPLYSQSVLEADALTSGIHLIPLIVASCLTGAFTGIFIQRTGQYRPLLYVAQVMLILGTGLFINLDFEQNLTKLFAFEIVVGIGVGMNMQPPVLAAQAAGSVKDTAAVVATMGFVRSIAAVVAVVVGGVIFQNEMDAVNPGLLAEIGPLAGRFDGENAAANIQLISALDESQRVPVRRAYFHALRTVWIMYVALAGLTGVLSLFVPVRHLKQEVEEAVLGVDREEPRANELSSALQPAAVQHRDR